MPKATVVAIIEQQEGSETKILLTKRSDRLYTYPGKWCLPGGHIDVNEPALEAVLREVKEETGLDYQGEFWDYFDEIIPEKDIHAVVLMYVGSYTGSLALDKEEVAESKWLRPQDALLLDLAFQHDELIQRYIDKPYSLPSQDL